MPKRVQILGKGTYRVFLDNTSDMNKTLALHKRKLVQLAQPLHCVRHEWQMTPLEIFEFFHEKLVTREKVDDFQHRERREKNVRPVEQKRAKSPSRDGGKQNDGNKPDETPKNTGGQEKKDAPKDEQGRGWVTTKRRPMTLLHVKIGATNKMVKEKVVVVGITMRAKEIPGGVAGMTKIRTMIGIGIKMAKKVVVGTKKDKKVVVGIPMAKVKVGGVVVTTQIMIGVRMPPPSPKILSLRLPRWKEGGGHLFYDGAKA